MLKEEDIAVSDDLHQRISLHDTRITILEVTMKGVEKNLQEINGNLARLVWLAITAIIGGFMAFVLRGGLGL